ncbi:MAG: hypothetical protein AABY22_33325 [Nanoarchaeota archaeon]
MNLKNINYKEWSIISLIIGIISPLILIIKSSFPGLEIYSTFRLDITPKITGTSIGLENLFTINTFFISIISAIILVFAGLFIYKLFNLKIRKDFLRLWIILFIGSIISISLIQFKFPEAFDFIGFAVNSLVLSFFVWLIDINLRRIKIPE